MFFIANIRLKLCQPSGNIKVYWNLSKIESNIDFVYFVISKLAHAQARPWETTCGFLVFFFIVLQKILVLQ